METVIPYQSSYHLGQTVDVTSSTTNGDSVVEFVAPGDVEYTVAEPNFTTPQFAFVESMKDVCSIFGVPMEYALKVQANLNDNPVIKECLKDLYKGNSTTVVFRINFLHKKMYMPQDVISSPEIADEELDESEEKTSKGTFTVNALEIGNELVVVLKIASSDPEKFASVSDKMKETLCMSKGVIDVNVLQALEKCAAAIDKKLGKSSYQDVECSIHYGSFFALESYPADLAGMVNTIHGFLDKCKHWADIFSSGVGPKVEGSAMNIVKKTHDKKGRISKTLKNFGGVFTTQQPENTESAARDSSDVDGDNADSFLVLASNADCMCYTRVTLKSIELPNSENESSTEYALSRYPGQSQDKFEKIFRHFNHANTARFLLKDFFDKAGYISEGLKKEGEQLLTTVSNTQSEACEAIKELDMVKMPSDELVENLCKENPLMLVKDYIERVQSKLPPGCDLDLLLMGKTGHGKSSTGNMILGKEKFTASASGDSVTQSSSVAWAEVDGRILKVIDTPGVCDTGALTDENNLKIAMDNLGDAIAHCPGGFHALLLVLSFGSRMTSEERNAIYLLKKVLGEDMIKTHGICIITKGDNFDAEFQGNMSFDKWCHKAPGPMGELFKECQYRCVLFNNKSTNPKAIKTQLIELVSRVDEVQLQRQGNRYTNRLFEFAQKQREKLETAEGGVTQEIMRDVELVLDQLKTIENNEQNENQLEDLSTIHVRVVNLCDKATKIEGEQGKSLLKTLPNLASKIQEEIKERSDETNEVKNAKISEELKAQTKSLQEIHETQLKPQEKKMNVELKSQVTREIKGPFFSGDSTVQLENGHTKALKDLSVGDSVLARNSNGELFYDKVKSFQHKDPDSYVEFRVLQLPDRSVALSDEQKVICSKNKSEVSVPAKDISLKDVVLVHFGSKSQGALPITGTGLEVRKGVFAPVTACKTIVIDSVVMDVDHSAGCFPADSTVELKDGMRKSMESLQIGDEVLVRNDKGDLCFDTVYMFGHQDHDTNAEFIELHIEDQCLFVSKEHLVFCIRDGSEMFLSAQNIMEGDVLMIHSGDFNQAAKPVIHVSRATKQGLFAPFTMSGTVVVDTAVMSCYVDVLPHTTAHKLLAPMRLLYRISPSMLSWVNQPSKGTTVPKWANTMLKWL